MANMSYCRWQNTLSDLQDCAYALGMDGDEDDQQCELSHEERVARDQLLFLAADMLTHIGVDVDSAELRDCIKKLNERSSS